MNVFLVSSSVLEQMKKKCDEKKKFWCSNVGWATAQTTWWELYCKAVIVLQ